MFVYIYRINLLNCDQFFIKLDFKLAENTFKEWYLLNLKDLDTAGALSLNILENLVDKKSDIFADQFSYRVKKLSECISKFNKNYRYSLEEKDEILDIRKHIQDLIGLRMNVLYLPSFNKVKRLLELEFDIIASKNKFKDDNEASIIKYEAYHFILKLKNPRLELIEYSFYDEFLFELQIRTVFAHAWSAHDHHLKYKRYLPNNFVKDIERPYATMKTFDKVYVDLNKRIRTFERREFNKSLAEHLKSRTKINTISFISFIKVWKKDTVIIKGNIIEIIDSISKIDPKQTMGSLCLAILRQESLIKEYFDKFDLPESLSLFIRHCLYLSDRDKFRLLLFKSDRIKLLQWIESINLID